jgi:hypothetical protein
MYNKHSGRYEDAKADKEFGAHRAAAFSAARDARAVHRQTESPFFNDV